MPLTLEQMASTPKRIGLSLSEMASIPKNNSESVTNSLDSGLDADRIGGMEKTQDTQTEAERLRRMGFNSSQKPLQPISIQDAISQGLVTPQEIERSGVILHRNEPKKMPEGPQYSNPKTEVSKAIRVGNEGFKEVWNDKTKRFDKVRLSVEEQRRRSVNDAFSSSESLIERTQGTQPGVIRATEVQQYKGMGTEFLNALKQTVAGLAETFTSQVANWPDTSSKLAAYKNQERLQPSVGGGFKATAARFTGQVLPQLAAGMVPGVGLLTVGLQERQGGEDLAREIGLPIEQAEIAGAVVGGVNTIIESAQIGTLFKAIGLDDAAKTTLKSQAIKNVVKRLLANKGQITKAALNAALSGGTEEALQQVTTIATPEIIAGRNPIPELWRKKGEVGGAFVGGFVAEGIPGGIGRVANITLTRPGEIPLVGEPVFSQEVVETGQVTPEQVQQPGTPIPSAAFRAVEGMGQDVTAGMQPKISPQGISAIEGLNKLQQMAAAPKERFTQSDRDAAMARKMQRNKEAELSQKGQTNELEQVQGQKETTQVTASEPTSPGAVAEAAPVKPEISSPSSGQGQTGVVAPGPALKQPWEMEIGYDAIKEGMMVLGVKKENFEKLKAQGFEIQEKQTVKWDDKAFPQNVASKENPTVSPYGLKAFKENGFWFISQEGKKWFRITDPRSRREYDLNYWIKQGKPVPVEVLKEYGLDKKVETLSEGKAAVQESIREQAAKPVSGQERNPQLRVVNSEKIVSAKPVDPKKFYSYQVVDEKNNVRDFVEVKGNKTILPGYEKLDTYYVKHPDGLWSVTEGRTGAAMGKGKTKKAAYEKALLNLGGMKKGTSIDDLVNQTLEKTGLSPRYGGKPVPQKNKSNWREAFDSTTDSSRKVDILRAIVGVSKSEKEISDVLDRVTDDLPGVNSVLWDIAQSRYASEETANKALTWHDKRLQPQKIKPVENQVQATRTAEVLKETVKIITYTDKNGKVARGTIVHRLKNGIKVQQVDGTVQTLISPIKESAETKIEDLPKEAISYLGSVAIKALEAIADNNGRASKSAIIKYLVHELGLEENRAEAAVRMFEIDDAAKEQVIQLGNGITEPVSYELRNFEQEAPEPTAEETLQEAKDQAAGQSLISFLNSVEVNGNKVLYNDEEIHTYPTGYYPTTADLEKLHSDLKAEEAARKGKDRTGELDFEGKKGEITKQQYSELLKYWKNQNTFPPMQMLKAKQSGRPGDSSWRNYADLTDDYKRRLLSEYQKIFDINKPAEEKLSVSKNTADESYLKNKWDGSKLGMRVQWAVQGKWITGKNQLSKAGEKIAQSNWDDLSLAAKNTVGRLIAKDYNKEISPEFLSATGRSGVSENTVFTKESREAALDRQAEKAKKVKRGKSSGQIQIFTPEDIKDAIIVLGYDVEHGIRTVAAFTKHAVEIFGDAVTPHLESIWNGIKTELPSQNLPDYTTITEPEPEPPVPPKPSTPTPTPPTPPTVPEPEKSESRVRGAAQSVENTAVDAGIISGPGGLGPLPTYEPRRIAWADAKVAEHEASNPGISLKVALGEETPAEGLYYSDYFRVVHNQARTSGDGATLAKLAHSPVTAMGTATGQFSQAFDIGERELDAMDSIEKIESARREKSQRGTGSRTDEKLQKAVAAKEQRIRELEVENLIQKEALEAAKKEAEAKKLASPSGKKAYGQSNKVVTFERHQKNKERLHALLQSEVRSGLDPRILEIGIEEVLYHLEAMGRKGASAFGEISAKMKAELGDKITPYLKDAWDAALIKIREDHIAGIKKDYAKENELLVIRDGVAQLTKDFIAEGVRDRETLITKVHDVLRDIIPAITREQTYNAVARYGEFKQASKDELEAEYRRIRGESLQLSKLKDMEKGVAPSATGVARQPIGDEQRRLIKLVNEAKKKGGFVVVDAAKKLKTALETKETRLKNRIADVRAEIVAGKRLIRGKTPSPSNARTDALQAELDDLLAQHKAIFGTRQLTDAQKLEIAEKVTHRAIQEAERKIAQNDIMPAAKQTGPMSANLQSLRAKLNTLRDELKQLREATPEYVAEQNRRSDLAYEKHLAKQLKEVEAQIKAGKFGEKPTKRIRQLSAEAQAIREILAVRKSMAREGVSITDEEANRLAGLAKTAIDLKQKANKEGVFPTEEDRYAYGEAVINFRNYTNRLINQGKKKTWSERLRDPAGTAKDAFFAGFGIPKALRATLDMSATLYQGITQLTVDVANKTLHPTQRHDTWFKNAIQSFVDAYNAFGGRAVQDAIDADIVSRPNYINGLYKHHKVDVLVAEEDYPVHLGSKIKYVGRLFDAAEVAFNGFQKRIRADVFDTIIKTAKEQGIDPFSKEADGIGKLANSITARGHYGPQFMENISEFINLVMFSGRLLKSDIDTLTGYQLNTNMSAFARKQGALTTLKALSVMATTLAIISILSPGSVEWDETKSTFGGIKIGGVWHMPFKRVTGLLVLIARLIEGKYTSSTGKVYKLRAGGEKTREDVFDDYLKGKSSPPMSVFWDLMRGEKYNGAPLTVAGEVGSLTVPLTPETTYEYAKNPHVKTAGKILAVLFEILGSRTAPEKYVASTPYQKQKEEVENIQESLADQFFKKKWEDLSPNQAKEIMDLQLYKKAKMELDKVRPTEPYEYQQPERVFEAEQRLFKNLPDDLKAALKSKGINSIGIGDNVAGIKLNDARLDRYERLIFRKIMSNIDEIKSAEDTDKAINQAKEEAREDLIMLMNDGKL